MRYTPILGTLGYIRSQDKKSVLMVHRNARASDDHLGKYNGLGGKVHRDEDIANCMKREIWEEAGVICEHIQLRGTVNWTDFGPKKEDWLGFIFLIDSYTGVPFEQNNEGILEWVPITAIPKLPMWEGDRHFLPLVFDDDPRLFHGYMPYDAEKNIGWSYTRV